jgi:hypothetical protein
MAGRIDAITNSVMAGWACTDDGSKSCQIRVDINGVPTYFFTPVDYRPDLAAAGLVDGYCSLSVKFPTPVALLEGVEVQVWNVETGQRLTKPGLMLEPTVKNVIKDASAPASGPGASDAMLAIAGPKKLDQPVAATSAELTSSYAQLISLRAELVARHAALRYAEQLARLRSVLADETQILTERLRAQVGTRISPSSPLSDPRLGGVPPTANLSNMGAGAQSE